MAFEKCAEEIAAAVGRDLTDKERNTLGKKVQAIVAHLEKKGGIDFQAEVLKATQALATQDKIEAIVAKRNAAINETQRAYLKDAVIHGSPTQPEEGVKALMEQSMANFPGSRGGVSMEIESLQNKYVQGVRGEIAKKNLTKIANSGAMDKEIMLAKFELSKAVPDEALLKSLPPEAVEMAKIYKSYGDRARVEANEAGANIGNLHGYIERRTHDSVNIAKAAGSEFPVGDKAHADAWVQDMKRWYNIADDLKDVPPQEHDKILYSLFEQFSNGYHLSFSEGGSSTGAGSMGKKMSHERVFTPKDAASEIAYQNKYGKDGTFAERFSAGLSSMGRDTAIMRKFGPNAKENLQGAVSDIMKHYTEQGRGDLATKAQKEFQSQMKYMWPVVTGEINHPGNSTAARLNQRVRNHIMKSKLVTAVLNSPSDLPAFAAAMTHTGHSDSMISGMGDAVQQSVGRYGKKITPEMQSRAAELRVSIDSQNKSISGAFISEMDADGKSSASTARFFELTGLTKHQDMLRTGAVDMVAFRHAEHSGKSFNELPPGMQRYFEQHKIGPDEWNAIRASEKVLDEEGRAYLSPDGVANLPDQTIASLIEAKGKEPTKSAIKKYRQDLETNYGRLFVDIAHMATTEPSKMNRAMMLRGTQPGTWEGEALRHFGLFKSFTVSFMQKSLGRELHGYSATRLPTHKALYKMMTSPEGGQIRGIANLMAWMTAMGYASMSLKDLAKGKEPRIPNDLAEAKKITVAAMTQGGAMGIYGDFLFGEVNRFGQTPIDTFLGPTFGLAKDISTFAYNIRDRDPTSKNYVHDRAAEAMRLALDNSGGAIPGYNLFYTRWALDYMFIYRLKEMMNPGYLKRMERKVKTEHDQDYIVPPSSVVPRGGF